MFISDHIFNRIAEKGKDSGEGTSCGNEAARFPEPGDANANALELYRNVRDRISSRLGFLEIVELLPPSLPLIPCFDLSDGYPIRPWEHGILEQYSRQPRMRQFEVLDVTDGARRENGFGKDSFREECLHTGDLPLRCPGCGKEANAISRGILTGEYEYFEYLCCGFFYCVRPYRHVIENISSLVNMDRQRISLINKGPHRSQKLNQLLRAFLCMEDQIIHEVNSKVMACDALPDTGGGGLPPSGAGENQKVLVFGRMNNNPGHVIFEDLAGIIALCGLLKRDCSASGIKVYVAREFLWYKKLLSLILRDVPSEVVVFPGGVDSMIKLLNCSSIKLENMLVPDPWPKDRKTGNAVQRILAGIAELSKGDSPQAEADSRRSIMLLHRFNNRKWAPIVENTIRYCKEIRKIFPDIEVIAHGVFEEKMGEAERLEEAARKCEGLRMLFNPELDVLLNEISRCALCVGPIGSGFWWPGLLNKPCVTLHPVGDRSNIHAYDWMAIPPKGVKPGFLRLLDHEKFICIEEMRKTARKVYEDVNVDVDKVLKSSLQLLMKTQSV